MDAWTALAFTVCGVALLFVLLRRLRHRAGSAGGALRAYLRHFDACGVPDEVSLAIFHRLQRWMADTSGNFPVRPGDSLERVYGIAPDEIADALRLLVRESGRRWPEGESGDEVSTVEDLVRFVARCPLAAGGDALCAGPGRSGPVG